jgi:GMC oxidoreductase
MLKDLELSALLVRCRAKVNGANAHYHFQISASALPRGSGSSQSDALLFQSTPDLDNIRHFEDTAPGEIDVSIRAVGEVLPNGQNNVTVPLAPPDLDECLTPRATATLHPRTATGDDVETQVMGLMNGGIDFLAEKLFGASAATGYLPAANVNPDGLGTTFHESGTLRMGDDPVRSVVNPDSQFHFVTNLYAGDAAVLPTCGSANPVMNGVAIRRRLARRIVPEGDAGQPLRPFVQYPPPAAPVPTGSVITLFDGTSLANWRMAGRGTFHLVAGAVHRAQLRSRHAVVHASHAAELCFGIRVLRSHDADEQRSIYSFPKPGRRACSRWNAFLQSGMVGRLHRVRNSNRQYRRGITCTGTADPQHGRGVCRQLSRKPERNSGIPGTNAW